MNPTQVDEIQTAGIIFMCGVIAYVVSRLEIVIRQGMAEIRLMLIAQKQTFDAQADFAKVQTEIMRQIAQLESRVEAHGDLVRQIVQIESRIETLTKQLAEKPKAPPRPRKSRRPPVNIGWLSRVR